MATDPLKVYNAIVRLGSARLARLVEELEPMSQSTISRLIKRLASQKMNMIHRVGYEWFPVLDLCSGAGTQLKHLTDLCSGTGTQLSQVKHSGTQLSQVKQNDVEEHSLENTPRGPRLGEDILIIAATADLEGDGLGREEDLLTEASLPIGGSSGEPEEIDEPAPLSLALRGAEGEEQHTDDQEQEPESLEVPAQPLRDMFSIKNHPAVMRHIVLKVRKARSRHNRGEGAKSAQARDKGKFYMMKLVPKDTIEDMEYLGDAISRSVAHGKWWGDEAMHVAEMTRLIPDWRHGYKKALWDLDMVGPIADEPAEEDVPATEPIAVSPTEPDVNSYDEMRAEADAEVNVSEDRASRIAREIQEQRAPGDVKYAAFVAEYDAAMARDAAAAAQEPAPAVEPVTEPAVDKDAMPADLTFDQKVRWCLESGLKRPYDIGEKTGEHMGVVMQSLNRQTTLHILVEYEGNYGSTRWRLAPGWGVYGKNPTPAPVSPVMIDGVEEL